MQHVPETAPEAFSVEAHATDAGQSQHLQGAERTKLIWGLLVANAILFSCYFAAGAVLLPAQVSNLDAARKTKNLATVTSISSVFTLFVQPLVGALSDRTRSRFGRRTPWIVSGAVLGGLMLILLPIIGKGVALIAFMWVLAQCSLNAFQGPLATTVSDRLDPNFRGRASGYSGVGLMLGIGLGTLVAGRLVTQIKLGYLLFGGAVIIVAILFCLLNKDTPTHDLPKEPFSFGAFLKGFWVSPKEQPDFFWAFLGRFTMMLGTAGISSFLLYILTDYVHLTLAEAGAFMGLQGMVAMVAQVVATYAGGLISDRTGRRKIFVFAATILITIAVLIPWVSPTKTAVLLYAIINGLGMGAYLAVDVAMMIDVLPNPEDAGKDLGILNIANNVPQAVAPLLMANLIIPLGGYRTIWLFAVVCVFLSAFFVFPIKKVR